MLLGRLPGGGTGERTNIIFRFRAPLRMTSRKHQKERKPSGGTLGEGQEGRYSSLRGANADLFKGGGRVRGKSKKFDLYKTPAARRLPNSHGDGEGGIS